MSFLHKTRHKKSDDSQTDPSSVTDEALSRSRLNRLRQYVSNKPLLFAVPLLVLGLMSVVHYMPRRTVFSYAGDTCRNEVTVLPSLYKPLKDAKFSVTYQKNVTISSFSLFSLSTCFTPMTSPEQGAMAHKTAPFGFGLFRVTYKLLVEAPPRIYAAEKTEPQPISEPIELQMNQPDTTFKYVVGIDDKSQECSTVGTGLDCYFDKLGLEQGATHKLRIIRIFAEDMIEEIAETSVTILPAATVVDTSIKNDEMIYTKPTSVVVTLDKTLKSATTTVEVIEGDKATLLPTQTTITDTKVEIIWAQELPREKTIRLTIVSAEAIDGSTLATPHVLTFKTSGGPKVIGINIGSASVNSSARVVVTLDQSLGDVEIASLATIVGGEAVISYKANQVFFNLQGIPRCAAFTLKIAKGLMGSSGVVSTEEWSHTARVSCRSTSVIGYSVRGRPIVAHYYGSGPITIFFNGGIHGSEPSSSYIMDDWASYLDREAHRIPEGKQVVIVPSLSPDGLSVGDRFNANGVNLARNFPTGDWQSDIVTSGGPKPGGGGSEPLSEPESQAIASLLRSLRPRVVLSYHSKGSLIGINSYADSESIGNIYSSGVGYGRMYTNAEEVLGYDITGEYETWVGEGLGIPCVLIELPAHTGRYFSSHRDTMWRMVGL